MNVTDSPYSSPEFVGYDSFGRPVYNRNARQKRLGLGSSLDDLPLAQSSLTTQPGGGNAFDTLGSVAQVAKSARDTYNQGAPTQYGYGTAAGGLLNPTSYGSYGPNPAGYTGPTFNSDWAAADAIDAGANSSWAAGDMIDAGAGAAAGADAGGSLLGAVGEYSPYVGLAISGWDMLNNGISGRNVLGALGSFFPGLQVMNGIIALGGGYDGPTPSMGAGGSSMVGPDGKLEGLTVGNLGMGTNATPAHFTEAQRIADTFGGLNLRPWAGHQVFADFGADADRGMDNPLYNAQFIDATGYEGPFGGRYGVATTDFNKLQNSMAQFAAAGPGGLASMDPYQLMALMQPDLLPEEIRRQVALWGPNDHP